MHEYLRKVHYYETDQMQVVHHSNYIRWMEEARIDYLDTLGVCYAEQERRGLISPVLSVTCRYHSMTRFGESVRVRLRLAEVTNVRYRLAYAIADAQTGELRAEGETSHCFITREGRPVSLKKADRVLFDRMAAAVEPDGSDAALLFPAGAV